MKFETLLGKSQFAYNMYHHFISKHVVPEHQTSMNVLYELK